MNTNELREKYLDYFVGQGHRRCTSDVLVPTWDPSVLFTPAGMNQFKDHFLGKVRLEFTRATSCQKCLRTGDIDNVGRTAYHHTFFEMLGNFSFGDYFKREAIHWAWEFLTSKKWLGMDPGRLTVTVYLDDDEAADIWHQDIGLGLDRIERMGEHDNFWPAGAPTDGPDGVCGPCSEIFFHPDSGKSVEIWNLVFTQFNRVGEPPDNLRPLPSKNIDTGMGLERAAATMQGVTSNFHIDILRPIVTAAAEVCGTPYDPASDHGRRLRRITDHIRACTMAIHENVYPGSQKEKYVVRRLLRRAVLDGHQMGVREPFLFRLVPVVVEMMRQPYPDLVETVTRVQDAIRNEEQNFFGTIDAGLARAERRFAEALGAGQRELSGAAAAELYQTYGVPPELVESLAIDRGLSFDWPGFRAAMQEHGDASGRITHAVMTAQGPLDRVKQVLGGSEFLGYDTIASDSTLKFIIAGDDLVNELHGGPTPCEAVLILDRSPFYGESGGQVGDSGTISAEDCVFNVTDTHRDGNLILHHGVLDYGTLRVGQIVTAQVDPERRLAIQRAHSATHILHQALQKQLGSHAQQQGSKVDADWLRFDFTSLAPVSDPQLHEIEDQVRARIDEAAVIRSQILPLAEARKVGAMMLFGEKYPDPVRMISMGDFSRELCGGTHLANSREVESFELISEEGVAAGTRRIVALTGDRAMKHAQRVDNTLRDAAELLEVDDDHLLSATLALSDRVRQLRKGQLPAEQPTANRRKSSPEPRESRSPKEMLRETARQLNVGLFEVTDRIRGLLEEERGLRSRIARAAEHGSISAEGLLQHASQIGNATLVVSEVPNETADRMRVLIDQIRQKTTASAVLLASIEDDSKVTLVAGVSKELVSQGVHAGKWVQVVAPIVGGGGGGRPDLAQAGGKLPENLAAALERARTYALEVVKSA